MWDGQAVSVVRAWVVPWTSSGADDGADSVDPVDPVFFATETRVRRLELLVAESAARRHVAQFRRR
jgi:hypothetical protein